MKSISKRSKGIEKGGLRPLRKEQECFFQNYGPDKSDTAGKVVFVIL